MQTNKRPDYSALTWWGRLRASREIPNFHLARFGRCYRCRLPWSVVEGYQLEYRADGACAKAYCAHCAREVGAWRQVWVLPLCVRWLYDAGRGRTMSLRNAWSDCRAVLRAAKPRRVDVVIEVWYWYAVVVLAGFACLFGAMTYLAFLRVTQ